MSVMSHSMLGEGIYGFSEVARLTKVSPRRIRAWFKGVPHRPGAVIRSDYADMEGAGNLVSFLDMVDALVIGELRGHDVPLQYLRKVHHALIQEFGLPHPFCRKNVFTDGKRVFIHTAEECGEERLKELLTKQYAFPEILLQFLQHVEYDADSLLVKRWRINPGIIIDPSRQYGKPIVDSVGIPTVVLAAAYEGNKQDVDAVANWYGIKPKEVSLAVDFEKMINGVAA